MLLQAGGNADQHVVAQVVVLVDLVQGGLDAVGNTLQALLDHDGGLVGGQHAAVDGLNLGVGGHGGSATVRDGLDGSHTLGNVVGG